MSKPTEPAHNQQDASDDDAHPDAAEQQQADHDDTLNPFGAHPTGERQAAENAENEPPA